MLRPTYSNDLLQAHSNGDRQPRQLVVPHDVAERKPRRARDPSQARRNDDNSQFAPSAKVERQGKKKVLLINALEAHS